MYIYRYTVDFSEVEYYFEIHEVLKRDLDLPDYYGGHPDALWDCMTDQVFCGITYIEIVNSEKISTKFNKEWLKILEVLRDTKHAYGDKYFDRFFVTIIYEDGTKEDIQ